MGPKRVKGKGGKSKNKSRNDVTEKIRRQALGDWATFMLSGLQVENFQSLCQAPDQLGCLIAAASGGSVNVVTEASQDVSAQLDTVLAALKEDGLNHEFESSGLLNDDGMLASSLVQAIFVRYDCNVDDAVPDSPSKLLHAAKQAAVTTVLEKINSADGNSVNIDNINSLQDGVILAHYAAALLAKTDVPKAAGLDAWTAVLDTLRDDVSLNASDCASSRVDAVVTLVILALLRRVAAKKRAPALPTDTPTRRASKAVSPENTSVVGSGAFEAFVGTKASFVVHTRDEDGERIGGESNLCCTLQALSGSSPKCAVQYVGSGTYEVTYLPKTEGELLLTVMVGSPGSTPFHVRDSPFDVKVFSADEIEQRRKSTERANGQNRRSLGGQRDIVTEVVHRRAEENTKNQPREETTKADSGGADVDNDVENNNDVAKADDPHSSFRHRLADRWLGAPTGGAGRKSLSFGLSDSDSDSEVDNDNGNDDDDESPPTSPPRIVSKKQSSPVSQKASVNPQSPQKEGVKSSPRSETSTHTLTQQKAQEKASLAPAASAEAAKKADETKKTAHVKSPQTTQKQEESEIHVVTKMEPAVKHPEATGLRGMLRRASSRFGSNAESLVDLVPANKQVEKDGNDEEKNKRKEVLITGRRSSSRRSSIPSGDIRMAFVGKPFLDQMDQSLPEQSQRRQSIFQQIPKSGLLDNMRRSLRKSLILVAAHIPIAPSQRASLALGAGQGRRSRRPSVVSEPIAFNTAIRNAMRRANDLPKGHRQVVEVMIIPVQGKGLSARSMGRRLRASITEGTMSRRPYLKVSAPKNKTQQSQVASSRDPRWKELPLTFKFDLDEDASFSSVQVECLDLTKSKNAEDEFMGVFSVSYSELCSCAPGVWSAKWFPLGVDEDSAASQNVSGSILLRYRWAIATIVEE